MEFRILGPLEARDGGRALPLGGGRPSALLALLLLQAGTVLSPDRLIDELWGESAPPTARKALQVHVAALRKALGPEVIVTRAGGYELRLDGHELDLLRFERLLAEARDGGDPFTAAELLDEALALWRGPPLADFAFARFAQPEIARLEELRLTALEERVDADLALGRHADAAAELERLVAQHPLRERFRAQLMLALYRSGRQAEALEVYGAARRTLSEELGLEPGPALRELQAKVLRQSPELDAPAAVANGAAPTRAPPAPRRRPGPAVPIAAALALAAAVAGVLALRGDSSGTRIAGDAVALVDPETGRLKGTVALGSRPGDLAVSGHSVWVTLPDRGAVVQIDARTMTVEDTVPVGAAPSGVAVGDGSVWVTNGGGSTVSRISPETNAVVQTIDVPASPTGILVDRREVWVASSANDTLSRIDPETGRVAATIAVDDQPVGLALDRRALWVANAASGTVSRVVLRAEPAAQSIDVGNDAQAVATGPGGVWVANRLDGTVSRIDEESNAVAQTIRVGEAPSGLAVGQRLVWVADEARGSVTRIDPRSGSLETTALGSGAGDVALGAGGLWVAVRGPEAAHRGGTLTVEAPDVLDTLDPGLAYFSVSWSVLSITNDGLVGFERVGGPDGATLVPDLARSIPRPTDGGLTYTFRLRPGIRYSTGAPLRAQDFRRAIERVFSLESDGRPYYRAIAGTDGCGPRACDLSRGIVADDAAGTVTFHLTRPDPDFLYRLTLPFSYAIPAGEPPFPATGPYRIDRYRKSRELVLARNPSFHEWSAAAQPEGFPDQIAWRFGASDERQVTEILGHRADLMFLPPARTRIAQLSASHAGQLHLTPRAGNYYLAMGTTTPPFDDVRVRRALNVAVDRAAVGRLFGPTGRPTCQILPADLPGRVPYCPYARDLARARKLVRASGTAGSRVTVWATPDYAFGLAMPVGRQVVGLLDALGYRARLNVVDGQGDYFAATLDPSTHVQVAFEGFSSDYPSESGFIMPVLSCSARNNSSARFCDRRLERRLEDALRLQAADPAHAHELWASIEHDLVDLAPWVPLVDRMWVNLASERVGNFQVHLQFGPLIDRMWIR